MRWLPVCVFFAVLAGHFLYATRPVAALQRAGAWAAYEFEQPQESRWQRYVGPGEHWLGLSYGLAGAFISFCLVRVIRLRGESLAASAGGVALGGLLWAAGCFFVGCCGSPMLPIYLGLLGPKFLGVTKPLTFTLTLLSITVGYTWMLRRGPKKACLDRKLGRGGDLGSGA